MQEVTIEKKASVSSRVESVDLLRGLVMVIMALDHVRDLWSPTPFAPEDLSQTNVILFFTRWITHLCAPTFIFLSGVSVYFYHRKTDKKQTSIFTATRGLWLMVVEIVIMSFIVTHSHNFILLGVFWVIGCCLILMAGLIWLPRTLLIIISAVMIAGHNLLPSFIPSSGVEALIGLFHNAPYFIATPPVLVTYTIIPWVGVMLAGFLIGPTFSFAELKRRKLFRIGGLSLIALFIVLRLVNLYGDPAPYSVQERGWVYTLLSFVNVTKYPPSLQFLTLTLGISLILLSLLENLQSGVKRFLSVFGSVPFFFFIVHFAVISLGSYLWTMYEFGAGINLAFTPADARPEGYEPNLVRVYVVWIIVLVITYFLCRWFRDYKVRNRKWWVSYL